MNSPRTETERKTIEVIPELCRQKYSRSARQDNSRDAKLTYYSDPKPQIPCLASGEEQRVTLADHEDI